MEEKFLESTVFQFFTPFRENSDAVPSDHAGKNKIPFKKLVLLFLGVYLLFVISIALSILYTEWKYFHYFLINQYVLGKIFFEALLYTIFSLVGTGLLKVIISYLDVYRNQSFYTKEGATFFLKGSLFLDSIVFLLITTVALPLRAVIKSFYVGVDGTYFRIGMVHLDTNIKIILSVFLLCVFFFYIVRKYKFKFISLIVLIALLATLVSYGIIKTRSHNFRSEELKIITLTNESLYKNPDLIDKKFGEKMKPLAENLLKISTDDNEKSSAYHWLAVSEMNLSNSNKALEYIELSISLDPNDSRSYSTKSIIYRSMEKFSEARDIAKKCAEIANINMNFNNQASCEADIAISYNYEGIYIHEYREKEYFDNARFHFENAIRLDPEDVFYKKALNEVLISEAIHDYYNQNFDAATQKLNTYIFEGDPKTYENSMSKAYAVRGEIKVAMHNYDEAVGDLEHSLTLYTGDNKAALATLSSIYWTKEDYDKAEFYLRQAITSDPKNIQFPSNQELEQYIANIPK